MAVSPLGEEDRIACVREAISGVHYKILSKKYNISTRTISTWRRKYENLAGMQDGFLPGGHDVDRTSTLYDAEGKIRLQWVKTKKEKEQQYALLKEHIDWLSKDIKGRAPLVVAPGNTDEDLLTVYPMGDPHFGLYSWQDESGENFDLDEAERRTCAAIDRLVSASPGSETALLINLGDFFHADNNKNETPGGGNKLDVDGRFFKVAQVGLRAMTYCVERLREKHKKVIVWNVIGNHDPHQAQMLALCMANYYHNIESVHIELTPNHYLYYRFGNVLIGSTHGHGAKENNLPLLMAVDRQDDWGATQYRYWYCGHIHHKTSKEHPGVVVETFRTLAASDAWHAQKGYRSGKDMQSIVHHKEYGEIERHTCSLKQITD